MMKNLPNQMFKLSQNIKKGYQIQNLVQKSVNQRNLLRFTSQYNFSNKVENNQKFEKTDENQNKKVIQESEKKDLGLESIENLKQQEENEDLNKESTEKVGKQIEKEIQEEQEQSIEELEEAEVEIEDLLGENQNSEIQSENKQAYKFEIDKRDDKNKFMVYTKYGLVKLVQSDLPEKQLQKIENIYYVEHNSPKNYLRKILKSDKRSVVIFTPNCNYQSILQLYKGLERLLNEHYFGKPRKPKNPFANCKTNKEIFDLNRRIQIEKKSMLDRICVLVNYDGSLRLKGGCPDVSLMKKFCNNFYKPTTQVIKHDFLIPFNSFLGINSADQYEKTGVQIQALNNKKIFPLYGVWPPTQQHYYKLLEDFIASSRNLLATPRNIIDIGCGTGVLGLIFNQKSDNSMVYALDKNEDAVKCSRLNSQIIDVAERYNAQCFDFVENSLEEQSKQFDQWHFPQKYDIIVSNPPWINAQPLSSQHSLDNGVYDYKEQFLINLFEFSKSRLNVIPKKSKQGRLLLLYSDLGEIMGLQEENRIQKLCSQYNLYINNQFETPLISDLEKNRKIQQKIDPLLSFKIRSKAILYEITRFQ